MAQRVVLTFDDLSLESLRLIKKNGSFSTIGTAVRESIQLNETLQAEIASGFTEIVLRNPATSQEKTIVVPSLRRAARLAMRPTAEGAGS